MPQLIVNPTGPTGNSYYVQNENDLLGNGKNGATPETATRLAVINPDTQAIAPPASAIVEVLLTRPNDTIQYATGDAIALTGFHALFGAIAITAWVTSIRTQASIVVDFISCLRKTIC